MNNDGANLHPIARISSFLTTLEPGSLSHLPEFYSEKIHFRDPINEGRGLKDLEAIYKDLFKQLKEITFCISVSRGDEQEAFLKWNMRYQFRGKARELPGVSYFTFGSDRKIVSQQDYWDAATGVFAEIPGLGVTIRGIRKKIQVAP